MDDNKKVEKKNFLSEEIIENFIFSNILHAVDNDYIKLDIHRIIVDVKSHVDEETYYITVAMEKDETGKTETFLMPYRCENKLDHLRSMMGLTMKILTVLEAFAKGESLLRIVK